MNSLIIIACHLALAFAAPQTPAAQYGPPNYSGQGLLSVPAPAPVAAYAPAPAPVAAYAPAPVAAYALAPAPVAAYAPVPVQYSVPAAAPAPAQYPVAPSSPVQYPVAPTPVQYPSAPAPAQYPAAPAPVQYPAAPASEQYPTAPSPPAQYPGTAQSPAQYTVAAPAPTQYSAPAPDSTAPAAPAAYTYPASAYSAPGQYPLSTGGELLSAPAPAPAPATPGGVPEEIVLPQNSRLEIRDNQGQYSHGFSDDKGTQVSEQGSLITTNGGWEYVIAKKGSYSYTSPEGRKVSVSYIADHNGYRILDQKVV